ncbi:hypothetical protein DMA11_08700 [Marinilabiliaceae bacterium JC017]|nr:hypothetical protein DMA11_08700 [Marinilabiliaceae bacterium JC017]
MKLITQCPDCQHELKIKSLFIENRLDLAKENGKEFELRCPHCQGRFRVHVDDVVAENDLTVPIIGGISFIAAVFLTLYFLEMGFIAYATLALPVIAAGSARQNQRNRINQFNQLHYDSKRFRIR